MGISLFQPTRYSCLVLGLLPLLIGWPEGQNVEPSPSIMRQDWLRLWEFYFTQNTPSSDKIPDRAEMVRLYIDRGTDWLKKDRVDLAAADFNVAIQLDPKCAEAYHNRALAHAIKGDSRAAIADFSKAIAIRPDLSQPHLGRGLIRLRSRDYDGAVGDFEASIRIDSKIRKHLRPQLIEAYFSRGADRQSSGDPKGAFEDYARVIELGGNLSELPEESGLRKFLAATYNNRGSLLKEESRFKAALADYDEAIRLNVLLPEAYANRAAVKNTLGDTQGAIADSTRSLQLDPNLAASYQARGFAFFVEGDLDKALTDLDRAIELQPSSPEPYMTRGIVRLIKGDDETGLMDLDRVLQLNPRLGPALRSRLATAQLTPDTKVRVEQWSRQRLSGQPTAQPAE